MTRLLSALFSDRYSLFEVVGFIIAARIAIDRDFIGAAAVIIVFTLISIAGRLQARAEAQHG